MIEHSIYEVYQRDKKVFIPEFGAFIYSEITDSIDFNDLLTFDDGKVITEIQNQQDLPEEEARNALIEYVQHVKNTLDLGNSHFFEGIGYLTKDDQGLFSINESMSSPDLISEEEAQEPQPIDVTENQESLEDDTNISDNSQEKENREEQDDLETSSIPTIEDLDEGRTDDENSATETEEEAQEPQPIDVKEDQEPLEDDTNISDNSQEKENREEQDDLETSSIPTKVDLDEEQTDDENSATETSEEELNTQQDKAFSHSPIISEEDEDVQQYYERKEEFYGHDDTRSPLKTAMWIVIPIILMVSAGFYYFTYYNSGKIQDKDELQQSKLSHSLSTETPVEIVAPEAQARDDKKNENEINSRPKNADTSGSGQQTKPDDSSSTIGQNKIYSLILGSFKVEDNADKLLQQLRKQGMEVEKFQRGNRVHFVGFENIEGKSNAVKLLTENKEKTADAWIIKKL